MSTSTASAPAALDGATDFERDWHAWHERLDADRRRPHGFLAYTGFHLLDESPQRFPDLPGRWSTSADGPVVALDDGETLDVGGSVVRERHAWGPIGERTFHRVGFGDAQAEVSRRGGRDIVRALHPDHILRRVFTGTPAYAPDPSWVVEAEFLPEAPRDIAIEAAIPVITHTHSTPGRVRFVRDGVTHTLVLISRGADAATLLFRDATSGVTTYAASRTLVVALPTDGSRTLVLDFNRASNLQCAYTDFAPCPLAPPENVLPFAVTAGEQTPTVREDARAAASVPFPSNEEPVS